MMALAFLALLLVGAAVVVYVIVRWRRMVRVMRTRVLIGEAMQRHGLTPADAEAAGLEGELAIARRRCAECVQAQACRLLLAESPGQGLPERCPNHDFFAQLAAEKSALSAKTNR
jgi:hypothetical protein